MGRSVKKQSKVVHILVTRLEYPLWDTLWGSTLFTVIVKMERQIRDMWERLGLQTVLVEEEVMCKVGISRTTMTTVNRVGDWLWTRDRYLKVRLTGQQPVTWHFFAHNTCTHYGDNQKLPHRRTCVALFTSYPLSTTINNVQIPFVNNVAAAARIWNSPTSA